MSKILITYATRALGLRVNKLLASHEVVLSTSEEIPSVLLNRYFAIPKSKDSVFAHEILKLALDQECEYVLPLGVEEITSLLEVSILFEEYGIKLLCPNREKISSIQYLQNPTADLNICLIENKVDLFTDNYFESSSWDGLCIASDSNADFLLAVV